MISMRFSRFDCKTKTAHFTPVWGGMHTLCVCALNMLGRECACIFRYLFWPRRPEGEELWKRRKYVPVGSTAPSMAPTFHNSSPSGHLSTSVPTSESRHSLCGSTSCLLFTGKRRHNAASKLPNNACINADNALGTSTPDPAGKCVRANMAPNPEFCRPTSIQTVRATCLSRLINQDKP